MNSKQIVLDKVQEMKKEMDTFEGSSGRQVFELYMKGYLWCAYCVGVLSMYEYNELVSLFL